MDNNRDTRESPDCNAGRLDTACTGTAYVVSPNCARMRFCMPAQFLPGLTKHAGVFFMAWALSVVLSACVQAPSSSEQGNAATETQAQAGAGNLIEVSVSRFTTESDLEMDFPQLWIFDAEGTLVSSEQTYYPGKPLNIETGDMGPVAAELDALEHYLAAQRVSENRWRRCGADYCVVRLAVDDSVGPCPPCGMLNSRLDKYFQSISADVEYFSIVLTQ